jgi:hypothetical protein
MADEKKGSASGGPQEDAILARLKGSGQTPSGITSFVGLLGRSSKPGYWLLYPSLDMSRSVEIKEEDIVHSEQLPPDQSPFGSLGGTRVFVKHDAEVTRTQTSSETKDASQAAADEFDLDIRLAGGRAAAGPQILSIADGCRTEDNTCGVTCKTCNTRCEQHTCANTCANTCPFSCANTQCRCVQSAGTCINTCQTCNTQCGTCNTQCGTCNTQCGQHTCVVTQCVQVYTCGVGITCHAHATCKC